MKKWMLFALLMAWGSVAQADTTGDAAAGLILAREQCAQCHKVEPSQKRVSGVAASFQVIADAPGMSAIALSVWFRTPHRNMPNILLESQQRQDLIAYITSLKKTP